MSKLWTPERRALALASVAKWSGTPHRDCMTERGVGIDCIRLVAELLKDSQVIPDFDFPAYNPAEGLHDKSTRMKDGFLRYSHSRVVSRYEEEFGDIAIFKTGRMSGHCAFVLDGQLVHSLAKQFVVVSFYKTWRHEIDCLIRIEETGLREQPRNLWANMQE